MPSNPHPMIPTGWRGGGSYFVYGEDIYLFEFLKKLFSKKEPETPAPVVSEKKLEAKPCLTCGKPISYDPSWTHIPNYCPECKAKYRAEHPADRMKRKCRGCGKMFTIPATLEHKPNYCRDCRAKFRKEKKA